MLEDMRRGGEAQAAQASMAKLNLDQQPPRVLGAPAQNYPPGPVSTFHYALCARSSSRAVTARPVRCSLCIPCCCSWVRLDGSADIKQQSPCLGLRAKPYAVCLPCRISQPRSSLVAGTSPQPSTPLLLLLRPTRTTTPRPHSITPTRAGRHRRSRTARR